MRSSLAHLIPVASLGHAISISLPPLIPKIPGVTEPLYDIVPPLPILQAPLPPLDSPPFTASDIKPKKIGYFWTGAGNKRNKGELFLVKKSSVASCTNRSIRFPRHLQPG